VASQGPLFPGTTGTLANAGTSENAEAWVSPGNIVSDNATEASITAATYDSPDLSQLLVASNFGFTIPASSTIDGITVEVDRRSIIAGSGQDFRVQLATGTAFANLVGSNKADTALTWPSTSTIKTYGGAADTWTAGLTTAQVNAAGFAVMLTCKAIIANADVGVDFIRVTVNYTLVPVVATPGVVATTTSTFAPTVTVSNNQLATIGLLASSSAVFAPSVVVNTNVVPATASVASSTFAPSVSTPTTLSPNPVSITLTQFNPVVRTPVLVTPDASAKTLTTFAPTVSAPDNKVATPDLIALATSLLAPTVTASDHQRAVPDLVATTTATFAATVTATEHRLVTPGPLGLTATLFAPDVEATGGQAVTVTPATAILNLTRFLPKVTAGGINGAKPKFRPPHNIRVRPAAAHARLQTFPISVVLFDRDLTDFTTLSSLGLI